MKIDSITIRGFRCFDGAGQTIRLDDLTCFVGPNASGKTAAMVALARVFGESKAQRQIAPSDFHLASGEELRAAPTRTLLIECRLGFPELEDGHGDGSPAVSEVFNQMAIDEPGGTPYCRVRLDAKWTDDGTSTGDVEQSVSWIVTSSDDPKIIEDGHRRPVQPGDRGKVRVVYVPATRDPDQQIRGTTATTFGRLLNALSWNGADKTIKEELQGLQRQVAALPGVQAMNTHVQTAWHGFYDGRIAREVAFQALEEDPAALLRHIVPTFRPGEDGRTMVAAELSDGLRSLFSLSLSLGLYRIEKLLKSAAPTSGFKPEVGDGLPSLTVFAVEEPENHLSPHYLGRVVAELSGIADDDQAQVVLSSHSPSILGRVEPDAVRYFLGHEQTRATGVKPIPLPEDITDEAFKYVREAIRGFPELYFSRLVILGEGASEEVVLRRLLAASGTPLDRHFISVVPLGGRHVNHFWRLLHGLGIPFLTLLDLDREKEGAGWGRIQYVRDQLVARFGAGHKALEFSCGGGKTGRLDDQVWDNLGGKLDTDTKTMEVWLGYFQSRFDVFFSSPLDLDLAMLEAFPVAYRGLAVPPRRGPQLPTAGTREYNARVTERMNQVLAADPSHPPAGLGSTYTPDQQALFAWYKYLFVDDSKPVTHMRALLAISDTEFVGKAPAVLTQLVQRARGLVACDDGPF